MAVHSCHERRVAHVVPHQKRLLLQTCSTAERLGTNSVYYFQSVTGRSVITGVFILLFSQKMKEQKNVTAG